MKSFDNLKKKLANKKGEIQESLGIEELIEGQSIEECIEKAEKIFDRSREDLEYKIIKSENFGFLGFGKKKKYQILFKLKQGREGGDEVKVVREAREKKAGGKSRDRFAVDGKSKILIKKDGVYIKVTKGMNGGSPATLKSALQLLSSRSYTDYEIKTVEEIVEQSLGEWEKVGEYTGNEKLESKAMIEIKSNDTEAYLTLTPPLLFGRTLDMEDIEHFLKEKEITYGVDKEKIQNLLEEESFNRPTLIAKGKNAIEGKDGKVELYFKEKSEIFLKEGDFGKVDFFGDLGTVTNVGKNQILAVKSPPTEGIAGKTVTGQEIEAKKGKDVIFEAGENARLSEGNRQIFSEISGRPYRKGTQIGVKSIYEVKNNVGPKTGSITFLGDVIIKNNIEDGFSVKAKGNIYIGGIIGKAIVESEEDIYVKRGILGKGLGLVKAGKNIIAKFIENSDIKANENVIAGEGILHSRVEADSVYSLGKRGTITGGHILAMKEVNSKTIGSTAYTETKIEVGFNPKIKEKLVNFEEKKIKTEDNLKKLTVNLMRLQKQKASHQGILPEGREKMLKRFLVAEESLKFELQDCNENIKELRNFLNHLTNLGKISAHDKIYPGTELRIRNIVKKIKSEYSYKTFILEEGEIKSLIYQEPKEKKAKIDSKNLRFKNESSR